MSEQALRPGEGSGRSTTHGYRIEARSAHGPHTKIGDHIFTKEWSFVETVGGWPGVPNHLWSPIARGRGLLTYAAAQALMAWAASSCDNSLAIGLEFRLVKFKCEESYTVVREGVTPPRSYFAEERALEFDAQCGNEHHVV